MRREEFAEIETRCLFQKPRLGRVGRVVAEGDEHCAGKVDHLSVNLKDFCGSLDLGLKPMRRGAEPG